MFVRERERTEFPGICIYIFCKGRSLNALARFVPTVVRSPKDSLNTAPRIYAAGRPNKICTSSQERACTHIHTRVTRRKFSTCVRIPRHSRWLSLRRREEQPLYKLRQFPSLNWRRLDRLEGQSFRTEKTPRPRVTLRKFHKKFREKCIDICIWYFDNKDESVRTDSINVILYSITANDIVLSMRWSILLLNSMSRNQYFSNCTTNIMYNKCVESGPIDTMLSLDRMLNNSYNIDTSLKRARAHVNTE